MNKKIPYYIKEKRLRTIIKQLPISDTLLLLEFLECGSWKEVSQRYGEEDSWSWQRVVIKLRQINERYKRDVKPRPRYNYNEEEVIKLFKNGKTPNEIAKIVKASKASIKAFLKRRNMKWN